VPEGVDCGPSACRHGLRGLRQPPFLFVWSPDGMQTTRPALVSHAGTVMAHTELALRIWFRAMHLMSSTKQGISAVKLGRRLGTSYPSAWVSPQAPAPCHVRLLCRCIHQDALTRIELDLGPKEAALAGRIAGCSSVFREAMMAGQC
jgi:hypothetical protein